MMYRWCVINKGERTYICAGFTFDPDVAVQQLAYFRMSNPNRQIEVVGT